MKSDDMKKYYEIPIIPTELIEKLELHKTYDVVGEWNGKEMKWSFRERIEK